MNEAMLLLRIVVGGLMIGHGLQKLWPALGFRAGTIEGFTRMGYRPASTFVSAAGLVQSVGGLMFLAGIWTPVGAAMIAGSSLQAIKVAKFKNGLWNQKDGYEYLLVLIAVALAVAIAGPGSYAIDPIAPHIGRGAGVAIVAGALVAGWLMPGFIARSPVSDTPET